MPRLATNCWLSAVLNSVIEGALWEGRIGTGDGGRGG